MIPFLIAGTVLCAQPVAAQAPSGADPRAGLWGGLTLVPGGTSATLTTSYSPPLLLDGDFLSAGAQTLTVHARGGTGFTAGADVFFAPHAGVQIVIDYRSANVDGNNGPYSLSLEYVSRPPPEGQPVPVSVRGSAAWPSTTGTLTQTRQGVNALVRLVLAERVHATISGGPALHRAAGTIAPIAFTTFRVGGHSVLFQDDYRLEAAVGPTYSLGFNGGGSLDVIVARHAAIVFGIRLFAGRPAHVAVRPTAILNSDQVTFAQPLDEIAARLGRPSCEVPLAASRFTVAFKLIG